MTDNDLMTDLGWLHDHMGFGSGNPAEIRVVVAMSGGVDSSVVAGLLKHAGYDVVGVTLQLYDHGEAVQRKGSCCAGQDYLSDYSMIPITLKGGQYQTCLNVSWTLKVQLDFLAFLVSQFHGET